MTVITQETENKYEARPGTALPALTGLPRVAAQSGPELQTLTAEYYDTSDLRLLKAGITLRRREGGADEGWHLKLPDGKARREMRVPLERRGDPVPADLACLVRAHTRGAALAPVARIQTRRRTTSLRDPAGTSLADVATDEVTAQTLGPSPATVSRWDETEVELTGGSRKLLRAVDRRLRAGGLRPARYRAKLERALGAGPVPPRPAPTRRSTAGEVVLAYLDAQAARLKSADPAVRRDEPDSVHQMRVTTRRLRSSLRSFGTILHGPAVRHLRAELKWLGDVLGDARDTEVLSGQLRSALASLPAELVIGPAEARVSVHYAGREADARDAVTQALDSTRYIAMLDELDRFLEDPPFTQTAAAPAREVLGQAVRHAARQTGRRIRRARHAPAGPDRDTALHQARKAAKRARYAAEAARPALGKPARRLARHMKAVQSALGSHHDAVNARAAAREIGIGAHNAGENAFTFGLLHERARHQADEHERGGVQAGKKAARRAGRRFCA